MTAFSSNFAHRAHEFVVTVFSRECSYCTGGASAAAGAAGRARGLVCKWRRARGEAALPRIYGTEAGAVGEAVQPLLAMLYYDQNIRAVWRAAILPRGLQGRGVGRQRGG